MPDSLPWTGNEDANRLLARNPAALLIGMLLDQQIPMERAFLGPWLIQERLGRPLDCGTIASLSEEQLEEVFKEKPAIHRFPGSMARRTHALCSFIVERYGGDPAAIWETAENGEELYRRLRELPGFGDAKARIFLKVLAEHLGVRPEGWEAYAADWPSIADVHAWDDIFTLREAKRRMKEAAKKGTKPKKGST